MLAARGRANQPCPQVHLAENGTQAVAERRARGGVRTGRGRPFGAEAEESGARRASMQTVACMRWGTLFPPEYVNRLYRGVVRNVSRPTRFIAFTDDPSGLDAGIEPRTIPPIRLPATGLGL